LFFAGITSSLAMGQPVMAFLEDELGVRRKRAALLFGLATLALGFVCVWLYPGGSFDEFDFWSGTFALVVFALGESFIFAYIFGIERGWEEITRGADIVVPRIFRFIIKYVTPLFILVVFVGALFRPAGDDWMAALGGLFSGEGWSFDAGSVIGRILHVGETEYGDRALIQDLTRGLLLLLFVACGFLVWWAWRLKEKKKP